MEFEYIREINYYETDKMGAVILYLLSQVSQNIMVLG